MTVVTDTVKETLLLAEMTSDLSEQCDQLRAELRQLGHIVLYRKRAPSRGKIKRWYKWFMLT